MDGKGKTHGVKLKFFFIITLFLVEAVWSDFDLIFVLKTRAPIFCVYQRCLRFIFQGWVF